MLCWCRGFEEINRLFIQNLWWAVEVDFANVIKMCFAVVQATLVCWAREKLEHFNFKTVPAVPLLITMFGTPPWHHCGSLNLTHITLPTPNTAASRSTAHDWGMLEVLDVSILLYAGEEKEYFMSSMAFFTHINSVKIWWSFFYVSGLCWIQ